MMKRASFLLCLAALLADVSLRAADPAAPLLTNGNFEADADGDGWPDHWNRSKGGVTREKEGDNHFLRLKSAKPGQTVMQFHRIYLPEGVKALELRWRQRISEMMPGQQPWFDARIMMDFKDASETKLKGGPGAPNSRKNTDGWIERSLSFLVPEGARMLEFMPSLFQVEAGTFDLDDITLKATDPAPLEAAAKARSAALSEKQMKDAAAKQAKAAAAAAQSGGSLITNGDFEADQKAVGWPDGWPKPKTGGSWETESGNHFLRLTSTEPGQTVLLYRLFDLPAETKALQLTWRQRVSDLKLGKESHFDARIMMEFKNAAGKKIASKPSPPNTRKNTEGWVERTVSFLVPEGALTLEFMPALMQVQKGTFDLDDFVLKPADPAPLLAAATAKAEADKKAYVPPEEPNRAKWPQELHVEGNKVLTKDGKEVWLQGVNVVSLEWSATGEQILRAGLVAIDEWKSNIIRLPVKETYWFGREPVQKDGGKAYRELVDAFITQAANRGAYVLFDLHRFRAPKAEHVEFWKDAARRYKDHPAVLFDLFNEPHGTSWEVWRNGGFVEEKKKVGDEDAFITAEEKAAGKRGFQAVGMQALLNAVRETGARNIVLVGGLDYAYDLSGIANGFAVEEKGGNGIIYSTHIYPWKKGWQEKVLLIADSYPILVGELGANTKKIGFLPAEYQEDAATWVPAMLGLIQKHKFHWTAFSFHPKAAPYLLTDWSYAPTPEWGEPVKRALAGEKFEVTKLR